MENDHQWLRHMLATLAYRGGKVLAGAPAEFHGVRACASGRNAMELLSHINDLLHWVGWMGRGERGVAPAVPVSWDLEVALFFQRLRELDDWLATEPLLACDADILFQGPIADALTHVGQLSMLRRMAGSPVRGEDYSRAEIEIGRVGAEQSHVRHEYD